MATTNLLKRDEICVQKYISFTCVFKIIDDPIIIVLCYIYVDIVYKPWGLCELEKKQYIKQ